MTAAWLALIATIFIAGAAQRITGLGFALIATPAALAVLGTQAVPFVAVIGAMSSTSPPPIVSSRPDSRST